VILFENYFPDVDFDAASTSDEVAVNCPFPHHAGGVEYFETVPSAHINVEKNVFHCKVCGEQHSEPSFFKKVLAISYAQAIKLIKNLESNALPDRWSVARSALLESKVAVNLVNRLRISQKTVKELQLGFEGEGLSFPVFVYGSLMDVRKYRPSKTPKVKSRLGVNAGYFIPDVAKMRDTQTVLICAGEKDMAIARSLGFEAYCITGGEGRIPKDFGYAFRGKKVFIIYDNDDAGINGAKKLGSFVYENGGTPHLVFGHHKVAKGKGEDLFDYLVKYQKTKTDLVTMLADTEPMSMEEYHKERKKDIPEINLAYAALPQYRNRYVTSSVQVTATYNSTFGIPNVIEVKKVAVGEKPSYNKLPPNYNAIYTIDETNSQDILYLMDSGLRDIQVQKNIRDLLRVPQKEEYVEIRHLSHATVYKSTVFNHNLSDENAAPTELDVYTFEPLENGHKYKITYKTVQHPLRQQELVLIAKSIVSVDNDLEDFKVTEAVKQRLSVFKQKAGETVTQAMDNLFQYDKGYIGAEANKDICQTVDLVYSTPMDIQLGKRKMRGALDVFMVGATRTGKSKTSKVKREIYNLGSVINLGTTTVPGLIGGTNKATHRTKIGLLPREHKNLVVLEEFSSMKDTAFIKAMTDIRSSNEVRIVRVDSDLRVPCQLRMLTISNPKNQAGGGTKSMKAYPNGIQIITELIDSPEDIARYDFFTLVPEPEQYASFLDIDYDKIPIENYRDRVRWIWTRKPNDIIVAPRVQEYLWEVSQELNKKFNTHIKIFGTEAWMKIARIAVASAGMLASATEDYEKIIVTKEHIDWAKDFLIRLYDNDVFKIKRFVKEQRKYTDVDSALLKDLQDLYTKNSTLFNFLEMTSGVTRATLRDVSGMNNEDFSILLNEMSRLYLFKWSGGNLIPSERFRNGLSRINRNVKVERGGGIV
jgi:5S rRNA maturation endonuclease (ribonuclease M5)